MNWSLDNEDIAMPGEAQRPEVVQHSDFSVASLSSHIAVLHTISQVNEGNAPDKLEKVIAGMAVCSEMLSAATARTSLAKRQMLMLEAGVFFGKYEEFCKEKGKKPSVSEGERFVYTQLDYVNARAKLDEAEAERLYFEHLRTAFDRAIGAIRSIVYGKTSSSSV